MDTPFDNASPERGDCFRGDHAPLPTNNKRSGRFACIWEPDQRRASDSDPVRAALLRRASTHWVRHTAASHQADVGTDLRHIQRNLRHASIDTTAIYLHVEDDERHERTTAPAGST